MTKNRLIDRYRLLFFRPFSCFSNFIAAFHDYQKVTDNNAWVSHTRQVLTVVDDMGSLLACLDGSDPQGVAS